MILKWSDYLEKYKSQFTQELIDFVSIPSISAQDEHFDDVMNAGNWVVRRLVAAGISNARLLPTKTHPVVYADWLLAGEDKPTILIYGHFDVQPVDPLDSWESPPFQPEIRDNCIFGRGASDDKGNMLAPIIAIEAYLKANGSLPVNVKFFYEGQEEIGSPTLPEFIKENGSMLSADMIFSSDGGQWGKDQPSLVMGLKGLVGCELKVTAAGRDLHSGMHGGGIANPIHALSLIISSMKDKFGKITVDGFYDDVIDLTVEDRREIAKVPFDEDDYCKSVGAPEAFGEIGYTIPESRWARPTLELNGIWGGYQGKGAKTVLPSEASAKITCRLVADQKPAKIYELLKVHIESNVPKGVTVSVDQLPGNANPFLVPKGHNSSEIVRSVLQKLYSKKPFEIRVGGSIPVMSTLLEELGVHATMFAFGLDDEQIHAPNEFFRLESFEKAQKAYCLLLEEFRDELT
ncbi:MAG: dipeptidase [Bacteroidetes bacterium]|jgi:acetylornithine deacetylase/succinyl-diaminopimelate desuccinylase-like protein|nr:dipeptidase [Bacteroidota bacterium]